MPNAVIKDGLVTYEGFDPINNDKRWVEEKDNWTYVQRQESEWSIASVPIVAYDINYLEEAKQKRYTTPPYPIEQRIKNGETAYYFWYGKDNWYFDKNEAIKFIYDKWDKEDTSKEIEDTDIER